MFKNGKIERAEYLGFFKYDGYPNEDSIEE